jgi:hypothetical protein
MIEREWKAVGGVEQVMVEWERIEGRVSERELTS